MEFVPIGNNGVGIVGIGSNISDRHLTMTKNDPNKPKPPKTPRPKPPRAGEVTKSDNKGKKSGDK